jgi:hypothetical protein
MSDKKELCIICAWRATCQKQFSLKAGQRCPDFTKDLSIKEDAAEGQK